MSRERTTYYRYAASSGVKVAVSAACVYWLVKLIDYQALSESFTRLDVVTVCYGIGLLLLAYFTACVRWWMLLRRANIIVPVLKIAPSYYMGLFFNHVLPTGVGGDAIRTLYLRIRGYETHVLIASAITDRVVGLLGVIVTCCIGFLFGSTVLPELGHWRITGPISVLTGLMAVYAFFPVLTKPLLIVIEKITPRSAVAGVRDLLKLFGSYHGARGLLAGLLLFSIVSQTFIILAYFVFAQALSIDVPLVAYFWIIPLVMLIQVIPLSLGGLGIREAALVGLLVAVGIEAQQAAALSLIFLGVVWLSVSPGLFIALGMLTPKQMSLNNEH